MLTWDKFSSRFGPVIIGVLLFNQAKYIVWLSFEEDETLFLEYAFSKLKGYTPIRYDHIELHNTIFGYSTSVRSPEPNENYFLWPIGSDFQLNVWRALMNTKIGEQVTYSDIADSIGMPKSSRAVANAVGANPISFLIPCHRIIRKDIKKSNIDNYRWGRDIKEAIMGWEMFSRGV